MSIRQKMVVNVVLYQLGWFATAFGASAGYPWSGPLLITGIIYLHIRYIASSAREFLYLCAVACAGYTMDGLILNSGIFTFQGTGPLPGWPPVWLWFLWMLFATLFPCSLRWLEGRPLTSAVLGAMGGPAAYVAGERLGALHIHSPYWWNVGVLALCWAVAVPLLVEARRLDWFRNPSGDSDSAPSLDSV